MSSVPPGEIEGGVAPLAGDRRAGSSPLEPARDHEVDDGEEVAFDPEHDSLAQPRQRLHHPSVKLAGSGIEGLEERRGDDPHPFDPLPEDPRSERVQVEVDFGKLRHRSSPVASMR